jgi:hypothetical protein
MPRLNALSAYVAQKIKPQKLPIKWRTAQELYAEEQLSWNLSQTVVNNSKKQGSTGGEMYKAILEDVVADWNSGKISDNKKRPFEEKESGASAHSEFSVFNSAACAGVWYWCKYEHDDASGTYLPTRCQAHLTGLVPHRIQLAQKPVTCVTVSVECLHLSSVLFSELFAPQSTCKILHLIQTQRFSVLQLRPNLFTLNEDE